MDDPKERRTRINFEGKDVDVDEVDFTPIREEWSLYEIADGSRIKFRTVVASIFRIPGRYDQIGNPVYYARHTTVASVDSPEQLKGTPSSGSSGKA